jgi:hypothetical protein
MIGQVEKARTLAQKSAGKKGTKIHRLAHSSASTMIEDSSLSFEVMREFRQL